MNVKKIMPNCEIRSKLTLRTTEKRYLRCSSVAIVNFEQVSHAILVSRLLALNE